MYKQRQAILNKLGYPTYSSYLMGNVWDTIRRQVLSRDHGKCKHKKCKTPKAVKQVHHLRYTMNVLLGLDLTGLITVCEHCHRKLEFSNSGVRLSPRTKRSRENKWLIRVRRSQVLLSLAIITKYLPTHPRLYNILLGRVRLLGKKEQLALLHYLERFVHDQTS